MVILEGIDRKLRGEFQRGIQMRVVEEQVVLDNSTDLTRISVRPDYSHRPALPQPLTQALAAGYKLGFQFIRVPGRIAMQQLESHLYKKNPEDLEEYMRRTYYALELLEQKGMGSAHVRKISLEIIAKHPELASLGEMRAFAWCGDERRVSASIAEWSDGEAIAAHYGFQHDIFCTLDEGKSAGRSSVLHSTHRAWLRQELGIVIMSPDKLSNHIRNCEQSKKSSE